MKNFLSRAFDHIVDAFLQPTQEELDAQYTRMFGTTALTGVVDPGNKVQPAPGATSNRVDPAARPRGDDSTMALFVGMPHMADGRIFRVFIYDANDAIFDARYAVYGASPGEVAAVAEQLISALDGAVRL